MTQEQMTALVAGYQADEVLKAALDAATSAEEAVRIAADHGYTISTDDLAGTTSNRDLSDDELEEQAGGTCCDTLRPYFRGPTEYILYCRP